MDPSQLDMSQYLTPAEVADMCGLNLFTCYYYIRNGRFKGAMKLGGKRGQWVIPKSAITTFTLPLQGNPDMGPGFWTEERKAKMAKTRAEKGL